MPQNMQTQALVNKATEYLGKMFSRYDGALVSAVGKMEHIKALELEVDAAALSGNEGETKAACRKWWTAWGDALQAESSKSMRNSASCNE